jgi:hypothetical protein
VIVPQQGYVGSVPGSAVIPYGGGGYY